MNFARVHRVLRSQLMRSHRLLVSQIANTEISVFTALPLPLIYIKFCETFVEEDLSSKKLVSVKK
ncbi:MAG TPA: hypothetical protein V6D09_15730 [Leptolyngbyaceae cyanobacterium]